MADRRPPAGRQPPPHAGCRAVVSTIGRDRPGIINELSELAAELDLNIDDSRMTGLGEEFAVLMSLTGSESGLAAFEARLKALAESKGFSTLFRLTGEREPAAAALPYRVNLSAMDHPGIVYRVTGFFASRRINIQDLQTGTQRAPHTGTPLFNVAMTIEVPSTVKIRALKDAFEQFCADQDLDGEISAAR